jgi:hypothetical protein
MTQPADQQVAAIEARAQAAGVDIPAERIERVRLLVARVEDAASKLGELPLRDVSVQFDPRWR